MGCLGCGCLIILVLLLLLVGLAGGVAYFGYKQAVTFTSTAPATFPPYNGSDDIYTGAQKKIAAFNQDVGTGKSSSLTLSADELNALLSHNIDSNPGLKKIHPQVLLSLDGDQARIQGSVPLDAVPFGLFTGRYFNLDATTGLSFNADTKFIKFEFHKLQIGEINVPDNSLPAMQANFSQSLNQKLRENTAVWNVLQVAKTVAIRDGQFVIETK